MKPPMSHNPAASPDDEPGDVFVAEALYTASRLGLPSDPAMLSLVPSRAFEEALLAGRAAGITDLSESAVSEVTRAFEGFARKARKTARAPGAPSSFGELAAQTKLAPEEARVLEELYFEHRGTPAELLVEARKRGVAERTIDPSRAARPARLPISPRCSSHPLGRRPAPCASVSDGERAKPFQRSRAGRLASRPARG